jgi:HAE1 family hydrophobic/amphiphilic exporter-1
MNLPRFAVQRPVLTVMVALIVIIVGIVSFQRLPIDLMPDITYPTLSITTEYENASPEGCRGWKKLPPYPLKAAATYG